MSLLINGKCSHQPRQGADPTQSRQPALEASLATFAISENPQMQNQSSKLTRKFEIFDGCVWLRRPPEHYVDVGSSGSIPVWRGPWLIDGIRLLFQYKVNSINDSGPPCRLASICSRMPGPGQASD
jgi:hypothetical protein